MYLEVFKLRELPFRLTPDPEFLYLSKAHARAKAYMESTVWFTDGFVVITGEIGCGKTTLIETFLSELEGDVIVARVNQTQISSVEFLQTVLLQFGFRPFRMKKAELLATLNDYLNEQAESGRKAMLVVDEAQNLSMRVLEEVRLLSGAENTGDRVLRIILAGQPQLDDKLDAPELEQLAQRVRLRFHLGALSPEDTQGYILHRLEVAGSQGRELFAPDTFELIFRFTGGVPRLINTLCDTSMLAASNDQRDQVRVEDVRASIEELQWQEHTSHTGTRLLRMGGPQPQTGGPERPRETPGESPLARIVIASGGHTVGERPLNPGRLIIGRTAANDLQIDSRFVSRHHCQIVTTPQSCVIEDLNSTNGVFVHSKRVRYHNLNDGDVVMIGQHELLYIDERPHQRQAEPHPRHPEGQQRKADAPFTSTAVLGTPATEVRD